ncbi:MAG: hypothetical protein GXO33_09105 [Epsilonproteobacteria bacterium]|nr:hypothetical protein [Campylobacterota bacterium]
MKNAESILDHLLAQPIYSRLRQNRCYRLIKKALPAPLQKGVMFIFVKEKTLFFALRHPAVKMEFDYKLPTIKSLLTSLPPVEEACAELKFERIRTFVSRYAPKPRPARDTIPRYKEHARPDFSLTVKDEALRREFEAIKALIARNRS